MQQQVERDAALDEGRVDIGRGERALAVERGRWRGSQMVAAAGRRGLLKAAEVRAHQVLIERMEHYYFGILKPAFTGSTFTGASRYSRIHFLI